MKKILLLNYEFPPLGGGAANATYFLLKEFAQRDDLEIDLITSSVDKFKIEKFSKNINIHYLNIYKKGNVHYQSIKDLILYSVKAYSYCKRLKKQKKFDLSHAFFGIPCGYLAMKLDLPYIVSLRGSDVPFYNKRFYWLDKYIFQHLSRKIWKKAKAVVANSDGLKKLALETLPKQKIMIIYNGVDTNFFQPKKYNRQALVFISTSRLIARKGVQYLLKAFIDFNFQYPNSKLLLIGEGDQKEELKQLVLNAGISQEVMFYNSVNHFLIDKYYQQADIFVLPSLNEGMSNSLLEAMASGLAIVATDTGGTKELVDSQNGIIVEKKNNKQIFDAFCRLQKNHELLEKMKVASRKKAQLMKWETMAKKYLQLYE